MIQAIADLVSHPKAFADIDITSASIKELRYQLDNLQKSSDGTIPFLHTRLILYNIGFYQLLDASEICVADVEKTVANWISQDIQVLINMAKERNLSQHTIQFELACRLAN